MRMATEPKLHVHVVRLIGFQGVHGQSILGVRGVYAGGAAQVMEIEEEINMLMAGSISTTLAKVGQL